MRGANQPSRYQNGQRTTAVELWGRPRVLSKSANKAGVLCVLAVPVQVPDITGADPLAASLLIECRGPTEESLQERIDEVRHH